ncbi:unnamed protein product [Musa textilis]
MVWVQLQEIQTQSKISLTTYCAFCLALTEVWTCELCCKILPLVYQSSGSFKLFDIFYKLFVKVKILSLVRFVLFTFLFFLYYLFYIGGGNLQYLVLLIENA